MKKIKVLVLGLALGIAGVAYAATGNSQTAHADGDAACCSMAGCCTSGACQMGGACCGSHGK